MVPLSAFAGVIVTQNVSPGATNWPGSPIITTLSNPTNQATVQESFNNANTSLGQTFKVTTTNYTLQTIDIYAGGGTGGTITLNLYDLGGQSAPNPATYTGSINLLGSGSGLSVTYVNQANGVLKFDFTGVDQVLLQAGHMYAFELAGTQGTSPVYWLRTITDTYSGGAAYRNRSWINGNDAREFALAVYGTAGTNAPATNASTSAECTVNWNEVHQRMDGFGGGVVFLDAGLDPVSTANMDTLYGTNNSSQLGLTLLRVRIDPTTNWTTALQDAQKAVARGAGVLATPWTPPASMKDNNVLTNGSLLPSQYATYASYLKKFADYMASNAAPLRAISVQNEPDWPATYESCVWSGTQFLNFFRTNAPGIGSTPVMMPESLGYNFSYSDPTLNDPVAVTNVDLIGGHLYGVTTIQDYPNAHNKGKPTWMTEFLLNDQTIDSAITTAKQIHDCLTIGNMSAYIWWKCLGNANGLVNASGVPQKRGFVMAQFSRFVRPGFDRIGVANNVSSTPVSAYKDTNTLRFAVVAINTNTDTSINQTIQLTNFAAASVTPWVTSESLSLASQPGIVVSNGAFTFTLPPLSVVTFVGQVASNTPPTLTPVPNLVTNAGSTLTITNTATDTNQPAQTLTFTLLTAPPDATLTPLGNGTNAVFNWRPMVSQANSTNTITLKVADSGTPSLSATNSFTVVVNPLVLPAIITIAVTGGQAVLTATGTLGPDYTVWASTNLVNWQALMTSNSPALPVSLVDTNFNAYPQRFYRIQIGP